LSELTSEALCMAASAVMGVRHLRSTAGPYRSGRGALTRHMVSMSLHKDSGSFKASLVENYVNRHDDAKFS